jgi:hypothetical protein
MSTSLQQAAGYSGEGELKFIMLNDFDGLPGSGWIRRDWFHCGAFFSRYQKTAIM